MKKISVIVLITMVIILSGCSNEKKEEVSNAIVDKQAIIGQYEEKGPELGAFYCIWDSPEYDIPLLLITDYCITGKDAEIFGLGSAYECEVYFADPKNNLKLSRMGELISTSSAYPIAATDEGLYCAGNHSVYEYIPNFETGELVLWYGFEDNIVNAVCEHSDELEIVNGNIKNVTDADANKAYKVYHAAEILIFSDEKE